MSCARKDAIVLGNVAHAVASSIVLRRMGHRRLAFYLQMEALGLLVLAYPRRTGRTFRRWPRAMGKAGSAIGKAVAKTGHALGRLAA